MTKFFQIGFNRCGTTSIHNFFQANGVPSVHYDGGRLATTMFDNLAQGKHILHGYERYSAFTDMEFLTQERFLEAYKLYQPIMEHVPDAKFILNIRDPEKWIVSRLTLSSRQIPINLTEKVVYRGKRILLGNYYEMYEASHGLSGVDEVAAHMRTEWDMHIASAKDAIPVDRLLVFNIESDSPLALCRFAGLDDAAAEHYRMTNRTDSHAVRYLRGRLPESLVSAIPKPIKRMAVGMLNRMGRA